MRNIFGSSQRAVNVWIVAGLLIGFFKARFVLAKTVRRVVSRLLALPSPIPFKKAYSPSYWILIGSMIALGMSFRFLPIPIDLRGMVDIAIGSALINGATLFFRARRECATSPYL